MLGFIVHTFVSAVLLFLVARMVSGVQVRDGKVALYGALGLGLANALIRPLLLKLALPITIITLGLFVWVVNALILMLVAAFIDGFEVDDFPSALMASALFGIMNFLVGMLLG